MSKKNILANPGGSNSASFESNGSIMHFARNNKYNIASSKSEEWIRTVESKATTRSKVDVIGEKVQSVVVAFGLDRLP